MANLIALVYVMLSCVFVTFTCGVLGQVWYLIVSIPDLCRLPYFDSGKTSCCKFRKFSCHLQYTCIYKSIGFVWSLGYQYDVGSLSRFS